MAESRADIKARLAAAWDASGRSPVITRLIPAPEGTPEGFAAWQVGFREPRSIAVLPELDPRAPYTVHLRYLGRAVATATGRCPFCFEVAGGPGEHWMLGPRVIQTKHGEDCPAVFTEEEQWLFPIYRKGEQ